MKKLITSILFITAISLSAQNYGVSSKKLDQLEKSELKSYKIEEDKFQNVSFITPKVYMIENYAYLSLKDALLNLRLVMEYEGDNWINFKKVMIRYNDKQIEYSAGNITTFVGKGYVKETSDMKCSPETISSLRDIVQTEKVYVRLEGSEKIHDFEMSNSTKKSIRLALELYDKLKN